jgi:hypothetical protein
MVHKLRSKENYYMKNNRLFQILPLALAVVVSGDAFGESETNSYAEPGFREDLQQGLVLIATSNAPVGAAGRAEIVAVNNNGTNSAVLFVKTTGLPNGSYTVSLTNLGGSQTYNLGSLNVATPTNEFGFGASGEQDLGHSSGGETSSNNWTNWVGQCAATNAAWTNLLCGEDSTNRFGTNVYQWYTNTLAVGSGSFALPSGLAQSNVAGVFVSDSGGNVDLTGDFTSVTNTTSVYVETVGLVPGTATKLQGQAILQIVRHRSWSQPEAVSDRKWYEHLQGLHQPIRLAHGEQPAACQPSRSENPGGNRCFRPCAFQRWLLSNLPVAAGWQASSASGFACSSGF